jgi:hypothetical protein
MMLDYGRLNRLVHWVFFVVLSLMLGLYALTVIC